MSFPGRSPRLLQRLAYKNTDLPPKVLILGPLVGADLIAEQLEKEGFESFVYERTGKPLPLLTDPNALEILKKILIDFRDKEIETAQDPLFLNSLWIHPGISHWADRPELAQLVQRLGFNSFFPPIKVMNLFSNRINLLSHAEPLGIPHLVLSFDPIYSVREFERFIRKWKYNYPIVLKSAKCQDRSGIFVLHQNQDFENKITLWFEQLRLSVGEVMVFPEKYLEESRHLIVPFARFKNGSFQVFPKIDSSLQSKYSKLIEFCPPLGIDPNVDEKINSMTEKLLDFTKYVGVGYFEFLVDSTRAFFLGGQACLNTGFHLWEKISETKAITWQLAAFDEKKYFVNPIQKTKLSGVSIRILAEDSILQLPHPGFVHELSEKREWKFKDGETELHLPIKSGDTIDFRNNGILGILFAFSDHFSKNIFNALNSLNETWITGSLQTNARFLSELLSHPWVKEGIFHTGFIEEDFIPEMRPTQEITHRLFGSLCTYLQTQEITNWSVGEEWVRPEPKEIIWNEGPNHFIHMGSIGLSGTIKLINAETSRVCCFPIATRRWLVRIGPWVMLVKGHLPTQNNSPKHLLALTTGRVHAILFRENVEIKPHEPIVILESLHLLVSHALPIGAKIKKWKIKAEDIVQMGQILGEIE